VTGLCSFDEGSNHGGFLRGPNAHQEEGKIHAFVPQKELKTFSRLLLGILMFRGCIHDVLRAVCRAD
jgi:hypothetical protein